MDIRYSCNQRDFRRYTTEEIRKEFLIEKLFEADQVTAVYSHVDRMVTLGVMPVKEKVSIDKGSISGTASERNTSSSAGSAACSTSAEPERSPLTGLSMICATRTACT